jgi:hypothetical protein
LTLISWPDCNSRFPFLAGKFLMRSGLNKVVRLKKHWRLVRLTALFFLFYTGGDLFFAQYFCSGERGRILSVGGR